jgi:signal transduction histidine kinase
MPGSYGCGGRRRAGRRRQLAYGNRLSRTAASFPGCTDIVPVIDGVRAAASDNEHVARSPGELITAVRAVARRPALWGVSNAGDVVLAVAVTIAAVITAARGVLYVQHVPGAIVLPGATYLPGPPPAEPHLLVVPSWALVGVVATTAPLAFRRTYPTLALGVILAAFIATDNYATVITVGAAIFAAYCAVSYSRHRRMTLLALLAGAIVITVAYPQATTQVAERYTPLLVLLPALAVGNMTRMWRERAGDSAERLRLAQAAHEAETRHALETERARIASELHDVVTHNVSVMVVQAGAVRAVLDGSPGDAWPGGEARLAREAMLAIEASGRTAMVELRHLLGLLVPAEQDDGALRPQPGLDQLATLVDRVRAAGLEAELTVTGIRRALSPGLDLAAYRVVQEALTNVIKHAGPAHTVIQVEYRPQELLITVADDGRPAGAGGARGLPAPAGAGGRGLIGLRERIAVHHGALDTGPRPGGGWRVRASIPLEPAADGQEQVRAGYQAAPS